MRTIYVRLRTDYIRYFTYVKGNLGTLRHLRYAQLGFLHSESARPYREYNKNSHLG